VLAALADIDDFRGDRTIKVFSLPAGVEVGSFPDSASNPPYPIDLVLSGSGTVLGTFMSRMVNTAHSQRNVSTITGSLIWFDTTDGLPLSTPIRLSPNGSLVAVPDQPVGQTTSTSILLNGAPYSAVAGWPIGWIDDDRLLVVNRYRFDPQVSSLPFFDGVTIVNAAGRPSGSPQLPELRDLQPVGADFIYSAPTNQVYSLVTGQAVWMTPSPTRGIGVVSGGHAIFASRAAVRAEAL
jgi:hypothetical protein